MDDDRERELQLAAGASQRIHLRRGSVILVTRGRVVLRPPMGWLAESVVGAEVGLDAEETYVVSSAGSVDLMATRAAGVVVIRGPEHRKFKWLWLWQLLRRACRHRMALRIRAAKREPCRHG
jgi:hypothetical protein